MAIFNCSKITIENKKLFNVSHYKQNISEICLKMFKKIINLVEYKDYCVAVKNHDTCYSYIIKIQCIMYASTTIFMALFRPSISRLDFRSIYRSNKKEIAHNSPHFKS